MAKTATKKPAVKNGRVAKGRNELVSTTPAKRGPGRPPGAKNKPKDEPKAKPTAKQTDRPANVSTSKPATPVAGRDKKANQISELVASDTVGVLASLPEEVASSITTLRRYIDGRG